MIGWLALAASLAADLEGEDRARKSWETLQDGLLLEAANGDIPAAVARYEALVRELAADDPVRSEALYWLANARRTRGDVDGARQALSECNRVPNPTRAACQDLLARIELEESSVVRVPTRWDFEGANPESGIVHPVSHDEKGSLRLDRDPDGDTALEWSTFVDRSKGDLVVVGFRSPSPTPKVIRFVMRSTAFDARVRLWVYATNGQRFLVDHHGGQVLVVPAARWAKITVELDEIAGFSPRQIDRLVVEDVTAFLGSDAPTGANALWIDDFEVE